MIKDWLTIRRPSWVALSQLTFALCLVSLPTPLQSADVAWHQTNGPLGGVVSKMITINNHPLASLYSGGLYNYSNSSWSQTGINHGLPENRSFDLVVDPRDENRIYAGLMIGCGATSTDGGETWAGWCDDMLTDIGSDNFSTDTLLLDPNNQDIIYAVGRDADGQGELVRSVDQGITWEVWSTFAEESYFNHLVSFNGKFYLVTRNHGLYVSADSGVTWEDFNAGLEEDGGIRFAVDETSNQLYLASGLFQFNVRAGGSLYVLSDDETTWETVAGPSEVTGIAWHENKLWVGTYNGEVWRTNNSGTLVLRNENDPLPASVGEFGFTSSKVLVGVGGYGIFSSPDNGQTFSTSNKGLKSMAMRQVLVDPEDKDHYYGVTWDRFGIYSTHDQGDSYQILAPDQYFLVIAADPQNFKHVYGGSGDFFYNISVAHGEATTTVLDQPGPAAGDMTAMAVHPNNGDILLTGISARVESIEGYGIYRSTDAGRTWSKTKGLPAVGVHSIIYNPVDPSKVYAAAFGSGVYKSRDGGKHWTKQIGGDRLKYVYRLSMDPSDPKILLAGSHLFFAGLSTTDQISGEYGGVFKTTDGGQDWTEITASIRDYTGDEDTFESWRYNFGHLPNYEEMLINPNDPDVMLIGHHGENVIMTTDNGATWTKPTSGMIPDNIHNYAYCLAANATFKKIYTCTCGRGMFKGTFDLSEQSFSWDDTAPTTLQAVIPELRDVRAAQLRALSGVDIHEHSPLHQLLLPVEK